MIFIRRIRQNPSHIQGERNSALTLARGRLVLMGGAFVLVYVLLALRAFDLSVLQARRILPELRVVDRVVSAPLQEANPLANIARAEIVDRNGVVLATSLNTASLFADARFVAEPKEAAQKLHKIFPDMSYGELLQKLQSGKSFVWIKRNITPLEQKHVLGVGEPGLAFEESVKRFYPQENLGGHLLGYAGIDNEGLAGVERSFDAYLRSHAKTQERLRLSMDIRLQYALRRELQTAIKEFEAAAAAGVIMDVTTGEILAGVSLPDFNPNMVEKITDNQSFSRLTQGSYELGSVFKVFSVAAFLENRDLPLSTRFDTVEPIVTGGFTIEDYHPLKHMLNIPEIFMHSSNIGTARMAETIGGDVLRSFYQDLGLLDPLSFEVKEVGWPQIPSPWRESSTLTASYGHGIATTPLQVAAAVSTVVNGGYLVKPRLVMDADDEGDSEQSQIRVVSEETSQKMRALLRLVVEEGTGGKADVAGYLVGGKTGTAEKVVNGRYDKKAKISSFVGVFPANAPRYVVYVMVDEPKGNKSTFGYATGGWVGAPVVGRVIASIAAIEGIPPVETPIGQPQFGSELKQYVTYEEER